MRGEEVSVCGENVVVRWARENIVQTGSRTPSPFSFVSVTSISPMNLPHLPAEISSRKAPEIVSSYLSISNLPTNTNLTPPFLNMTQPHPIYPSQTND